MSDSANATVDEYIVQRWQAPEHSGGAALSGPLTASKLAEIEKRAYAEGLQRGLEEGRRRGEREVAENAQRLEQLFNAIEPMSAVLDEPLLAQVGELVLAIAKQFIRREISREPGEIVRVVREALAVLPASDTEIRIVLHPEDAELVNKALKPETVSHPIRIIEDLSLTRGGARIETDVSVVDATVEARFGAIAAKMFGDERQTESQTHER